MTTETASRSEIMRGKSPDGHNAMAETGIFTFQGKEFSSGGAYFDGQYAIGYIKRNPDGSLSVQSWGGETIGQARIISSWKLPLSCYIASTMYQIETCIDGIFYTGRGCGERMLWKGKRKARQAFGEPSFAVRMRGMAKA